MIRLRTASALAVGTVAALALGGTALAAGNDGPSSAPAVEMLPDGTVVGTPSPSASSDDDTVSPEPSPSESTTSAPSPAPSSPAPSSSASSADAISLKDAKAIAVKAAGGGRVTDIERDTEHGRAVWDVEVRRGSVEHDIDVDRATGEVLRHRSDRDDDSDDRDHDDRYDD